MDRHPHQEPTDAGCMQHRSPWLSEDWMQLPSMAQNTHIYSIAVSKESRNGYTLTRGSVGDVYVRARASGAHTHA